MDQPLHRSPPQGLTAGPVRTLTRAAIVLAIAGLLVLVWSVIAKHRTTANLRAAAESAAVLTVATTRPEPLAGHSQLILPGNLQANYEAPIYARTSGYLKRWLTDIGTPVKAGQLLAEIETPEVDQELRQAEADVATAQANAEIARVTAARWVDLRKSDSVSKQDADEKVSQAESSAATLKSAEANRRRLQQLTDFKRIVAPFDGIVTARETDVGQLINAGSGTGPELFRVADTSRLRLYVRVPQPFAASMRPDLIASVQFPDRPGFEYTATLARTANAVDPVSRTMLVELSVDNRRHELLPGAYSEVHFKVPDSPGAESFRVPANTLLFRSDGLHVATVDASGHVALKSVEIGRDYGAAVEITRGLSANDQVILSPPDSLTQGVPVRVVGNRGAVAARS